MEIPDAKPEIVETIEKTEETKETEEIEEIEETEETEEIAETKTSEDFRIYRSSSIRKECEKYPASKPT